MKAALRESEATLPADIVINTDLFQLKSFIDRGIYYVEEALVIGAVLVVIVLFLFLLNLRTTFITLTAIPLSLVITTLVFRLIGMHHRHRAFDQRDDARRHRRGDGRIGRRRHRRRREHLSPAVGEQRLAEPEAGPARRLRSQPRNSLGHRVRHGGRDPGVHAAVRPVRRRRPLFMPLGVAYIVSILASLLVSLTVTPVLSYYLLPQSKATHRHHDGLLLRVLKWVASYLIRFSMRHAGVLLLVDLGARRLQRLAADAAGRRLPAEVRRRQRADQRRPAGRLVAEGVERSFGRHRSQARRRCRRPTDNPDGPVLHFARRTGRAELDEHAQPVNVGEYILTMNPHAGVRAATSS